MKIMFLLTDNWPFRARGRDQASSGMVTEDEGVAKVWKTKNPHHGYLKVRVVSCQQDVDFAEDEIFKEGEDKYKCWSSED